MRAIMFLALLAMLLMPLFVHGQQVKEPCYVVDVKFMPLFLQPTNRV